MNPPAITRLNAALEGRYRIERELGQGGMATVYLADDVRHERKVALKVLKPELAAVVGAERFLAEIKTTANLQHPHILPLFDSGEADGFLFFVMPYVEGESLRDRLNREGELPVDEAVRIATAAAGALDYAHRHGVIHRDIKPANILLHDGEPLVADFGIALAVSVAGGGRLTETGLSLGTPYYMSPEQATAERDPDARSDVYALGCVLYEMLVGEPPYTGGSAQAVLGKILTTDPVRPTEHRRTVPAHVDTAVLKALEKRPADRFGSVGELAAALADPRFGIGTKKSAAGAEASQGASRLWMSTAILALSVAASVLFLHLTEDRPWPHQLRYTIPLPTEGDAEGLYFYYRVSPDGRYVAVSGVIERSSGIFVREMSTSEWRVLAGTGVSDFFWSPDSRTLAFFADGKLKRVGVDGGPVEDLAGAAPSSIYAGSGTWGSEGDIVFSADQTGPLMRVSATGGEPVPLTQAEVGIGHRYPAFLPDGEHLLFTIRGGDSPGVYLVSLDDPAGHRLLPDVSAATFAPTLGQGGLGHVIFAREGRLMAQPFDSDALELTGDAFPLTELAPWNDHGGVAVSASDNGILIYPGGRHRRTDSRLFWLDREGAKLDTVGPVGTESSVTLSSTGRIAALVRQSPAERTGNVWLRDLDRRREDPLTFDGEAWTFTNAVLAPDDDRVVYAWTDLVNTELRITPVRGSGNEEAVASGEGGSLNPTDWTGSGYLIYTRIDPETGADLWYVRVDDDSGNVGEPVPFRTDPFETSFGQVSPDGEWIAYLSDETGFMEVWVEPFPAGSGRWRVSESQSASGTTQQPRWSANGRELFYITGAGRTLMVAPFAPTAGGSPVGEPRPLFDAPFNAHAPRLGMFLYDVADDGQRFLASLIGGAEDPVLNVLVNWQDSL